jgi:hypothetical protein
MVVVWHIGEMQAGFAEVDDRLKIAACGIVPQM